MNDDDEDNNNDKNNIITSVATIIMTHYNGTHKTSRRQLTTKWFRDPCSMQSSTAEISKFVVAGLIHNTAIMLTPLPPPNPPFQIIF